MRTLPWMRSFQIAVLALALTGSHALATPVTGPVPPEPDAVAIAALTNTYLEASIGATTMGGWLDATLAGGAVNRGQSLIIPGPVVIGPNAGEVTINNFNNSTKAIVTFDNGAGGSGTVGTFLTQFNVTYKSGAASVTFDTFCIDLLHEVTDGQVYAASPRNDLDTAFTNGARMAFIINNFGTADLSSNPDQAAAVQIALWDLSLNNRNPTSFGQNGNGTYDSGDAAFIVDFRGNGLPVSEPSSAGTMRSGLLLLGAYGGALRVRKFWGSVRRSV